MASTRVAPGSVNTVACRRLSARRVSFDALPPPPGKEGEGGGTGKEDKRTLFEIYMSGLKVEPLKGAYLLFVPVAPSSAEGQTGVPDVTEMFCARTDNFGAILRIDESEIGRAVPKDEMAHWALFKNDGYYLWFWTLSNKVFQQVLADVKKNPAVATTMSEFDTFQVVPASSDALAAKAHKLPLLELPLGSERLGGDSVRGRLLGRSIFTPHPSREFAGYWDESDAEPFLIARCGVIDAVYAAELLHCHAVALRQRSIEHAANFSRVDGIIAAAEAKAPVDDIDAENRVNKWGPEYYQYAYECARDLLVERATFCDAISVSTTNPDRWIRAADHIEKDLGHRHPCRHNEQGYITQYAGLYQIHPVERYFDFYRFGTEQKTKNWHSWQRYSEQQIAFHLDAVRAALREFMDANLAYFHFMSHLDMHFDADPGRRADFHDRYLRLAQWLGYRWWEGLERELEHEAGGELPEAFEWVAELGDKTGRIFAKWLGDLETIKETNHLLKSDAKAVEKFLNTLYRYHAKIAKTKFEKTLPGGKVKVDIDFAGGMITFRGDAKLERAGPFEFMSKVRAADGAEFEGLVDKKATRVTRKLAAKALKAGQLRDFEVKAPYKMPVAWPSWLEAAGAVFASALTMHEICVRLKREEDIDVWLAVQGTHDVLIAVDTVSNALATTMMWAGKKSAWVNKFAEVGEMVKGPGFILEAAMNLHEGGTIILVYDKSSAVKAWKDGDTITGHAEFARGFVLVSSTTAGLGLGAYAAGGAIAAGGGAAAAGGATAVFAAFCTPLGIALAIGGVISVCISVGIYIHRGSESTMKEIEDALNQARDEEFGDTGNKYAAGWTADSLERFRADMIALLRPLESQSMAEIGGRDLRVDSSTG